MVTNFTGRRDVDCSSSSLTFDYGFSMNSAANESWRDDPDRPSRNSGILEKDWEKRMIQSMLNAGTLTFKEFAMREPLPLATIHDAVLEFLRRCRRLRSSGGQRLCRRAAHESGH